MFKRKHYNHDKNHNSMHSYSYLVLSLSIVKTKRILENQLFYRICRVHNKSCRGGTSARCSLLHYVRGSISVCVTTGQSLDLGGGRAGL